MSDDDLPTPPLFGEAYYAATILDIVCRHCKAEDGLDSRGDRLRAELMMICEEDGFIEISDQFGWLITAKLTPEGLNTLATLAEQEFQEWAGERKDGNEPLVPNKETIEAMKAAERGEVTTVPTGADLIAALQASPYRDTDIEPERFSAMMAIANRAAQLPVLDPRSPDEIIGYQPDPEKPRQLTPEEARRLDKTPIDYSDIPPLDEFFFTKPTVEWPPQRDKDGNEA